VAIVGNDEKRFDCMAMKRRAAKAIHQRLEGKSPDERLEYWKQRTEALQERQRDTNAQSTEE
jgi:hypothetical protein